MTMNVKIILLLALVTRLWWLGFDHYRPPFTWQEGREKSYTLTEYDKINIDAVEISKGRWPHRETGEPLAWRPIGYPAFLGLLYAIFGASYWTLYGSTLILQLLTIWIFYKLWREVFSERTALIAAFLFAIYPVSIYSTSLALDEHLFVPLWIGGLYLLIREVKRSC